MGSVPAAGKITRGITGLLLCPGGPGHHGVRPPSGLQRGEALGWVYKNVDIWVGRDGTFTWRTGWHRGAAGMVRTCVITGMGIGVCVGGTGTVGERSAKKIEWDPITQGPYPGNREPGHQSPG